MSDTFILKLLARVSIILMDTSPADDRILFVGSNHQTMWPIALANVEGRLRGVDWLLHFCGY